MQSVVVFSRGCRRFWQGVVMELILLSVMIPVIFATSNAATTTEPSYATVPMSDIVEHALKDRLNRFESHVQERVDTLSTELNLTNNRLQALERHNIDVLSLLDNIRSHPNLNSEYKSPQIPYIVQNDEVGKFQTEIDNIDRGVRLTVAALKILSKDVTEMKNNITILTSKISDVAHSSTNMVTKQYFNTEMSELKHQFPYQVHQPPSLEISAQSKVLKSCADLKSEEKLPVVEIKPDSGGRPFMVSCDLEIKGGGWTIIQHRFDGSQDFYQNWHDYKFGFGNLKEEFWLGLEKIYQLTGHEVNELLIELVDFNGNQTFAHYSDFSIGAEVEGYALKVLGGYRGTAGDSLYYHAGSKFSTRDVDQDAWPEGSCARAHGGGWWYKNCDRSNLNGRYLSERVPDDHIYQGLYWEEFRGANYSLLSSTMLVRPKGSYEKSW